MAQNISYRTVGNTGSLRSPVFDKQTGQNPQQVFAMHAAIKAQRDAKIEQRRQVQAAKDRWRDEQLSGIASTEFVNTVHESMHEPAKDWLDAKYQRYGEIMDTLNSEGMNSSNPQWRELQNEAAGIRSSYENLKKGLEGFRARRVEAIDMRNPENNDNPYNEVAKTPDSENSMGFLVDRELKEGYGNIQIADDGSFTFADTDWNGELIGSDNLPTLTVMPYKQQNELQKNELVYGNEIQTGKFKIGNEGNEQRIRTEIEMTFKDFSRGELQAYLLNDMDGAGGTPSFINYDELLPDRIEDGKMVKGDNPELKWTDRFGKEQTMLYKDLLNDKKAMVSFATHFEFQGTLDYMKSMVPEEETIDTSKQLEKIANARKDSISQGPSTPKGYKSYEDFYADTSMTDKQKNAYLIEHGTTSTDEKDSNRNLIHRLMDDYNKSISVYPYTQIFEGEDAFTIYFQNQTAAQITGKDGETLITREEARDKFNKRYGGAEMFTVDNRNGLTAFRGDINDDQAIYDFLEEKEIISPADKYGVNK